MKRTLTALIVLTSLCCASFPVEADRARSGSPLPDDAPEKISLCDLVRDRAAYDKKLIQVTAFISRGFEDSALFDPQCSDERFGIWVEIGGKSRTGVMYCCGVGTERTRKKDLIVEGVTIPLVGNEKFKGFDKLMERVPDSVVKATVVGRFFSGRKEKFPRGEVWVGYGHMGMNSLFVIKEVVDYVGHDWDNLDYGSAMDQPNTDLEQCGTFTILFDTDWKKNLGVQRKADTGESTWAVNDPERVGREGLAEILKEKVKRQIALTETRRSQGRVVYHWRPNGNRGVRYMVVVSRPYWLSTYAKSPEKTAWVVTAAYSICDN